MKDAQKNSHTLARKQTWGIPLHQRVESLRLESMQNLLCVDHQEEGAQSVTVNYFNLKLFILTSILRVLSSEFLKCRILEICNFHTCAYLGRVVDTVLLTILNPFPTFMTPYVHLCFTIYAI